MGWVIRSGDKVVDASGINYVLADRIGEGGQGIVFSTTAQGAAVKVLNGEGTDERRSMVDAQIARVIRMPIADLPVAAPRFPLIGDAIGYTMTAVTGMVSLSELILDALSGWSQDWYVNTGGIRKRLEVLESLSDLISVIHARGLVYCDLSANNVLVSESPDRSRIFLIDLDNLCLLTDQPRIIFSPPFAAPEQKLTGATQSTDLFSLAVLGYALLAATNPFYGKQLDAMPPEVLQKEPHSALAPWIDDANDSTNSWEYGIPRVLTISPALWRDFVKTFVNGRENGTARASASQFASDARRAKYALERCSNCTWDNFVSKEECVSCGAPLKCDQLRIHFDQSPDYPIYEPCPVVVLNINEPTLISASALGFPEAPGVPGLRVSPKNGAWSVQLMHESLTYESGNRSDIWELDSETSLTVLRARRLPVLLRIKKRREA